MTRCCGALCAGILLGILIPTVTGLLLIEFTEVFEKDFRA